MCAPSDYETPDSLDGRRKILTKPVRVPDGIRAKRRLESCGLDLRLPLVSRKLVAIDVPVEARLLLTGLDSVAVAE